MAGANSYSRQWFDAFLGRIDASLVAREVAFLERHLPPRGVVLDLCCGPGRHSAPLVRAGYRVVGLDRDASAVREAAVRAPRAAFVRADMRRIPLALASVDAVICMWQSFGHLDSAGNAGVLSEMARVLRPEGHLVLDVYHHDFHAGRLGERVMERDGRTILEQRTMRGKRLRAVLRYESGTRGSDEFEWELYTPSELAALGESVGLRVGLICAEFDESVAATEAYGRMQIVFRRS